MQLATFYVDTLLFGIDVMQVQEVIRRQELTRVPLASPVIEGLINLRGQIITAVDLRRRLGLSVREQGAPCMNVIVQTEEGSVSFVVDRVGDVVEVSNDQFEPTPSTLDPLQKEVVTGVYKLSDQLLLSLNSVKALEIVQHNMEEGVH